jgi:hypothetical protein
MQRGKGQDPQDERRGSTHGDTTTWGNCTAECDQSAGVELKIAVCSEDEKDNWGSTESETKSKARSIADHGAIA